MLRFRVPVSVIWTTVILLWASQPLAQVEGAGIRRWDMYRHLNNYTEVVSRVTTYPNIRLTNDPNSSEIPKIVCDANYCYIVWQDNRNGNSEIYWCKTDHNGVKIVNNTRVTNTSGSSVSPTISADGSGHSCILWQEGTPWGVVYFARLDGDGNKITTDQALTDGICLRPAIATLSNGVSNIVWERRAPGIHYLLYNKLDVNGDKLCSDKQLSNWNIVDYDQFPQIACDGAGYSYITWRDINNWDDGIWLGIIGTNCSIMHDLQYYHGGTRPDIAASPGGNIEVVFEYNNKIFRLLGQWDACQLSQGVASSQKPAVGTDGTDSYAVWQDNRDGNWEVYFNKFTFAGQCNSVTGDQRVTNEQNSSINADIAVVALDHWFAVWQDNRDGNNEIYWTKNVPVGHIAGNVKDANTQENLQDVLVEAKQGTEVFGSDQSDVDGDYHIPDLVTGDYDVDASKLGYETQTQTAVTVSAGQTTTVDFQLMPLAFADVSGLVQDSETEDPVPSALVELRQNDQTIYFTQTEEPGGNFSFDQIYSGDYEIRVTKEDYDLYVEQITIDPGWNVLLIQLCPLGNVITLLDGDSYPVQGAFVKRYVAGVQDQEVLVSDENGKVRFSELYAGDEIYAYEIIGVGRTDKGGSHPKVPDEWCTESLPPGCDPCTDEQPWYYFYKYVIDNQSVDQSDRLSKYYYEEGVQTVYLTHQITRLHLVLSHNYDISAVDKSSYIQAIHGHFEELNKFLCDASNGQVLIDQVDVYSGKDNNAWDFSDIRIYAEKQKRLGQTVVHPELSFPPYLREAWYMFSDYRYKDWADFCRGMTHELGHYFFNLGDEYYKGLDWICKNLVFKDWCTGENSFQDYHASVMVLLAEHYPEITEFCWDGHDNDYRCWTQNKYHDGMSCWDYIVGHWNSFENNIPDPCQEYLLGDPIEWRFPQYSPYSQYQGGPYLEIPVSTSQKPAINDFIVENPSARELNFRIHDAIFGSNVKGVSIGVQSGNRLPMNSANTHMQGGSFELRGFWELGSAVDTIRLVGILPGDVIVVFAENYDPVHLLTDTIPDETDIEMQRCDPESTFFDYLFGEISVDGTTVNLYLLSTDTMSLSPSVSIWQGASGIPIQGVMFRQDDTTYSFSFPTDSNLSSDGVILIQDAITGQTMLSSWEYHEIKDTEYNTIQVCNQATIYMSAEAISGPGYVLGLTSIAPEASVSEDVFGCVPQYISFSGNVSFMSPAVLGLHYGTTTIDSTAVLLRWDITSNSWQIQDSVYSVGDKEVYCEIEGNGLFVSRVKPVEWINYGDANGDGVVSPGDVVYLLNYLFRNGPAPDPLESGDVNCDGLVTPPDVVCLINYLFRDGPPPGC